MSSPIEIGYKRKCSCPENHLSCVEARQWLKNQLGVWQFQYEARDVRSKDVHPAVFPISLATRIIEQFSHAGELILDPFVGTGTTLVAAQDLDRNAIGFDINEDYIELAKSRISRQLSLFDTEQFAIREDARNISNLIEPNTVKLLLTSPPYANLLNRRRKNKSRRGDQRKNCQYNKIEQYSQDERDLGTLGAPEFEVALKEIFAGLRSLFLPSAHLLINITDAWIDGKRVPLHISVIKALESAGYEFRNTIIWDRRNIVNRIGIFGWPSNYITMGTTFEYILDFTVL